MGCCHFVFECETQETDIVLVLEVEVGELGDAWSSGEKEGFIAERNVESPIDPDLSSDITDSRNCWGHLKLNLPCFEQFQNLLRGIVHALFSLKGNNNELLRVSSQKVLDL
jgi:hypothetical protein